MKRYSNKHMILPILFLQLVVFAVSMAAEEPASIPLLVETDWPAQNQGLETLRLIDIGRKLTDFEQGHIPQAVYFDRSAIWGEVGGVSGMLPAPASTVQALRDAGIGNTSTVVIYDAANGLWAARLFWALEYLGHGNVHVLNGRLRRAGKPL